ncbi:unnamed protein product [Malus baccata var. baccata]
METGAKVWRKPKPSFRCGPWVPRRNSVELRPRHALKMLRRPFFVETRPKYRDILTKTQSVPLGLDQATF